MEIGTDAHATTASVVASVTLAEGDMAAPGWEWAAMMFVQWKWILPSMAYSNGYDGRSAKDVVDATVSTSTN